AATLLTPEPVVLRNVPRIIDTRVMGEILGSLGGAVEDQGDGRMMLRSDGLGGEVAPELARRMRASIVLLGPLVARVGMARLPRPGGDSIGARRVEQHLRGLRAMGAEITETASEFVARAPGRLRGARRRFGSGANGHRTGRRGARRSTLAAGTRDLADGNRVE